MAVDKENTIVHRTSLRSLCVLVPLMGVSWVLGIFYVSEDLFFIQYFFAICNGLQVIVVLCNSSSRNPGIGGDYKGLFRHRLHISRDRNALDKMLVIAVACMVTHLTRTFSKTFFFVDMCRA